MGKHKTASKRSEVLATSDLPSGVDRVVSEKQAAEILNLNYFTLRRLFAAGRARRATRCRSISRRRTARVGSASLA
jgi:hypothetical protein